MRRSLRTIAHLSALIALISCKEPQPKVSGVGDSLQPFIVMNTETSQRYCQVCAYGGKPKIMVVADLDDASVEADLVRVQKLIEQHVDKGLVAFALFGEIASGKFTPIADDAGARARLEAMRTRLGLSYPVTVVPSSYTDPERKGYTPFVDSYDIQSSRRVLCADVRNAIVFAETIEDSRAPEQWAKLEAELAKL